MTKHNTISTPTQPATPANSVPSAPPREASLVPATLPTLTIPAPAPESTRAQRITYYHTITQHAGKISIAAAIAAGIELHRAKAECAHGNFTLWIKRNCEFAERTARRYMTLAESVVCADSMADMLEDPEPPTIDVLEEHIRPIEAKTLTQLYFDLGICRPGKVGGARPGAGRPPQARDAVRDAGAAWGACGIEIDKAMAWQFTRFLPAAMAREAFETITLLRDALRERLDELKQGE